MVEKIIYVFLVAKPRNSQIFDFTSFGPYGGLMIAATETITCVLQQEMRYSLTRRSLLDFIAATEACFVSWEIITLFSVYGMKAFIPLLFLNLIQK